MREAVIVSTARTGIAKAMRGGFNMTHGAVMGGHAIQHAIARAGLAPAEIEDVFMGAAHPEGATGMNIARLSAIRAGCPVTTAGVTINRFCSSGLQAVALAADQIRMGNADLMLAGGTESMSMVPMMGNKVALSPSVFKDDHVAIAYGMGITAEKVAEEWKVSREDQDIFALASHQKAIAAIQAGEFRDEISPYEIVAHLPDLAGNAVRLKKSLAETDEGPRTDTSLEGLGKLRPVFRNGQFGGTVTAGNSSQMSDGAGAVLLASEQAIKDYGLTPLARFVSFSVAGVRPEVMGIGPIAAIPKALKQAGLTKDQLDWIELNEAFAAQSLAVIRDSQLDPAKINPLGGAIALGHPLGATGAVRTATIVHGLRRRRQKYGMVTMCIGTGMGAAGVFEAV
jgi:acetyl-CoA acyltransferase